MKIITKDGKEVKPGDKVWVYGSYGSRHKTTVSEPVTNYVLHTPIPVSESFSSLKALKEYERKKGLPKSIKIRKGCVIVKIQDYTEDTFIGHYKGRYIEIEREKEDSESIYNSDTFYIRVTNKEGRWEYDGYYTPRGNNLSIKGAIEEALIGSCLIKREHHE